MPTQLQHDNLRLVEQKLRQIEPDRFNFRYWVNTETWKGAPDFSCGTTGCGLGWATTIPELRVQGLCLDFEGFPLLVRKGREPLHWVSACQVLFGLKGYEAQTMFDPLLSPLGPNPTALQLADYIAGFLQEHPVSDVGKGYEPDAVRAWLFVKTLELGELARNSPRVCRTLS